MVSSMVKLYRFSHRIVEISEFLTAPLGWLFDDLGNKRITPKEATTSRNPKKKQKNQRDRCRKVLKFMGINKLSECSGIKVCAFKSILDNNRKTFPVHQSKHSQHLLPNICLQFNPFGWFWNGQFGRYQQKQLSSSWQSWWKLPHPNLAKAPDITLNLLVSNLSCVPLATAGLKGKDESLPWYHLWRPTRCQTFTNTGRNSNWLRSLMILQSLQGCCYHLASLILEIQWDFSPGCCYKHHHQNLTQNLPQGILAGNAQVKPLAMDPCHIHACW